jgi:formylmethanofuran dehydrogenase subunit D
MKGEKTISIEGDDIKIRFDFGAVVDFCKEEDIKFSDWESKLDDPEKIMSLAYHMAKDHNDVDKKDFRRLGFNEMPKIMALINESTDGIEEQAGNGKKGKKK